MSPREHHRFFAKQLIPTQTFQSPDAMFGELTGPRREAFLMHLWNEAANAVASPIPHVAMADGKVGRLEVVGSLTRGDAQVVVLSMPPAINPDEAAFIAIARQAKTFSVFLLERTSDRTRTRIDPRDAVLAEMRADGSRINHGIASGLDLAAFKRRVGAALGFSLDGIESSLPEVTAVGSLNVQVPASQPAPGEAPAPAAARAPHVGGFLATLLVLRGAIPLALWMFRQIGMFRVHDLLAPVLRFAYPLLSLLIGVYLLIWLYQVHARRRGRAVFSPGMAVGGWFIPVANVILAPLIVRSAWKATVGTAGTWLALGWWIAWLMDAFLYMFQSNTLMLTGISGDMAIVLPGAGSVPVSAFVGDLLLLAFRHGVFVTVLAYGLLYHIVRRVSERL